MRRQQARRIVARARTIQLHRAALETAATRSIKIPRRVFSRLKSVLSHSPRVQATKRHEQIERETKAKRVDGI